MKLLFENWRGYLKENSYALDYDKPLTIEEVIESWIEGNQPYTEDIHTVYPIDSLLEYRDIDWHEGQNPYPSGGFESLARHIKKKGIPEPIIIAVGKNGQAKISKGNQMLMIAKQMGLKELPVKFIFQDNVQKANKTTADPAMVNRQIRDTQDEDILKRKLRT
tara:strand:- start:845 stop:1333 length:489 start_codon:yes stop_codon:yes gene_type:complete